MIGKEGRVIEDIDNFNETGRIIVDGMEWTARAVNEQSITSGQKVVIREIQGVKAMVVPMVRYFGLTRFWDRAAYNQYKGKGKESDKWN